MKSLNIFLYEWKHFVRSPFKVVALLLFVLAGGYGLHSGASLYHEQLAEIEGIRKFVDEERQEQISYYEEGKTGPEDQPWVDLTTPFWAIWFNNVHHFKTPSPAMVYSLGQAEQYGFYKHVTFMASPYDADMTAEIANPERQQAGTLDFSFSLLFLFPLLMLIMLYNLKSAETEKGFLPLIEVQTAARNTWLLSRTAFYVGLLLIVIVGLLSYGAMLTDVFALEGAAYWQMLLYSSLYLAFWSLIYYLIIRTGTSIMGNTLKMVGVWLVFAFIIPSAVHQWISIEKPVNLMTDLIDATRDEKQKLYDLPDSVFQAKLDEMFPEILDSPVAKDEDKRGIAYNRCASALVNELVKNKITLIEADNKEKNTLVRTSYWFNPMTFFQNQFNRISQTDFDDYQKYRNEIQHLIDHQIRVLVLDTWKGSKVDKSLFEKYHQTLSAI